ncbi:MAG: PilZ domain-containing protein [Planctomycetes bacterium]|nr:PilZ domain-containing protein [Planctomycetota bacterium]
MSLFHKNTEQERYRVQTDGNELEMVLDADPDSLPTEIVGLSMDGVGFFLSKEGVDPMEVGDGVHMTFYDMRTGLKVHVVGEITEWTEEENTYLVDVRFTQTKSLADQLGDSETWRHFNRRQHYRVHPRMSHCRRCTVRLQWRGHDAEHVIHDISAGGLSIRIANNNQVEVPPDRPIKAFLELPHSDEILEFTLRFVHEIDAVSHRRVGFAVDTIRTPFAAQVEDQLVAAVMEWQRTAIQVASNNPLPNTKSNG